MEIIKNNKKTLKNEEIIAVANKYSLPIKIAKIMLSRVDYDNIEDFILPDLDNLMNPNLFENMGKVIEKINYYKSHNKKVLVYGDYDVDGITACSILCTLFKDIGINFEYFIPDRVLGYGLSKESLDLVISKFNPDAIITVDCGITSVEEVEYIKSKNIDIIITDHHQPQEILPDTIIINPHLESLKFKELCGAGVAYFIVRAYYNDSKIECAKYLPIVTIGTIADMVPLLMDNRIIVSSGLKVMNLLPKGMLTLIKKMELDISNINTQNIGFKIAPTLNSVGRMNSAIPALKLFLTDDEIEIETLCEEVINTNKQRQYLTEKIFKESSDKISYEGLTDCIVLKDESWDSGIKGIVASRLVEKYNRPVILFNKTDNILKGSCRSIEGINIFECLSQVKEFMVKFGGHKMAAGLTVNDENFDLFKEKINLIVSKLITKIEKKIYYDEDLELKEINVNFAKKLSILEPFGEANEMPIFNVLLDSPKIEYMKNMSHLTIIQDDLKFKYFNGGDLFDSFDSYSKINILTSVGISNFKGIDYLNLIIQKSFFKDCKVFLNNERILENYFSAMISNIEKNEIFDLENCDINLEDDSVLIVTYVKENYLKIIEEYNDKIISSIGTLNYVEKDKNICFALNDFSDIYSFKNIYFLEENFTKLLKNNKKLLKIAKKLQFSSNFEKINLNKQEIGLAYRLLKYMLDMEEMEELKFKKNNIKNIFNYAKFFNGFSLSYVQFLLSFLIMEELNIIEFVNEKFTLNLDIKTNLEDSYFFKTFCK